MMNKTKTDWERVDKKSQKLNIKNQKRYFWETILKDFKQTKTLGKRFLIVKRLLNNYPR